MTLLTQLLLRIINPNGSAAGRQTARLSGRRGREKKLRRSNDGRPTPSITLTIALSRAKLAITVIERKAPFFYAGASPTDSAVSPMLE